MNTNIISKYLQFLRKSHNYTQDDLAQKLGISRQAVSKWETGISIPDLEVLLKISKLYEVTINDILEPQVQLQRITDFEQIPTLPETELREALKQFDTPSLVIALMGASPETNHFVERLFPDINYETARMNIGRIKLETVEDMQKQIITMINLLRENDACHMNIFNLQQLPDQDIRMFLIRAKNSTYITGSNTSSPSKPASRDYLYSKGDYTYTDTYMGEEHFAGEEAVWVEGTPVYAMNYYGQILSENFDIAFLKEMLSLVSYERPFRGPEYHQKGDYAYHCQVHGDFDCFHGEEIIYCKQEKVYFCMFHGGSLS